MMSGGPISITTLMWRRLDVPGTEIAFVTEQTGRLAVRGSQHALDPVPYSLTYQLHVGAERTALAAHAEGADWSRRLELARVAERWHVTTESHGASDLAAFDGEQLRPPAPPGIADPDQLRDALDVDLGGSPMTNSLPLRRLQMLHREPGWSTRILTAWVLPPTLEVVPSVQSYAVEGSRLIRYGDASSSLLVEYASDGWVAHYQGVAERVTALPRT